MSYGRFFAMIATSTVVMFGLMYLNTYLAAHVFWSETRAYMALLMGATMAVIMLAFMLSMYSSRRVNAAIFIGAIVVFGASLWLVRSQATIGDRAYMRAMIPHHSIAIMTSSRADISDPRVRKLADEIIYAQDKEIAEMRYLIADIGVSGDEAGGLPSEPAEIVALDRALSTAEITTLDPQFLGDEQIGQLFPNGPTCVFRYTADSRPVLAIGNVDGATAGLIKISGDLVQLPASETSGVASAFASAGLMIRLQAVDETALPNDGRARQVDADMLLKLDDDLSAGYRGYFDCHP